MKNYSNYFKIFINNNFEKLNYNISMIKKPFNSLTTARFTLLAFSLALSSK